MNISRNQLERHGRFFGGTEHGFTITELLFTTALLSLVFGAVFICQFYGMQMHNFIRPKLDNATFVRETVTRLAEDIRCAQSLEVGQGTHAAFIAAGSTNAQMGNAIRIWLAGNTNQYIYYFRDAGTETLQKKTLGSSNAVVVAREVTNSVVFQFENFQGVLQSNSQNQTVVDLRLQMRQSSLRLDVDDSYRVRTKITRRAVL